MRTATRSISGRQLTVLLALACASCLDTASKDNDNTQSIAGASGGGTAGRSDAEAGGRAGAGGSATAGAAAGSGGAGAGAGAGAGEGAGGMSADSDAGVPDQDAAPAAGSGGDMGAAGAPSTGAPDPTLVNGTGTMCSSYGAPMNGKCGGYFCGVDMATLEKAVDPMAKCGGAIDLLCSNAVVTAVGMCARQVKGQMPTATNDMLRPMVQDCVFQNADIKARVTPDCLACTITAAECAGDMCLAECLAGDNAQCDACRKMNNCEQPVFECGGIPSPF